MVKSKKQTKEEKVSKNKELKETETEKIENKQESEVTWKPVAKEKNKRNGNLFAKMKDFFDF